MGVSLPREADGQSLIAQIISGSNVYSQDQRPFQTLELALFVLFINFSIDHRLTFTESRFAQLLRVH